MSSLSLIADRHAESINGGYWKSMYFNSFSKKSIVNNLNQTNYAKNIKSGFGGLSSIMNEQVNLASITNVIG